MRRMAILSLSWAVSSLPLLAQDEQKSVPLKSNGLNFVIHEPHGYDAEKAWPLFVLLHGTGDTAENFIMVWDHEFARKKMFMIAVNGTGRRWNDGRDREAVYEAVEYMKRKYSIDPLNVWLGGFSAGGSMTLRTVNRDPAPWRGFVVVGAGGTANPGTRKCAAYVMCGEKDRALPMARRLFESCRNNGMKCEFNLLKGYGHRCPQEKTPEALRWMIKIMEQTAAVRRAPGGSNGAGSSKRGGEKLSIRVGVADDVDPARLKAIGRKIQDASDLLYRLTRGQAWIAKARILDRLKAGDIRIEGGKTTEECGSGKVGLDVTPRRLVHELLHKHFGLAQEEECGCFMNCEKPGTTLCGPEAHKGKGGSCWQRLLRKYRGWTADARPGKPPKVEIKIRDR